MTRPNHQLSYVAALETAHSELDEILATYKELQIRKERLEAATEALGSLFESEKQVAVRDQHALHPSVEPRNGTLGPVPDRTERFMEFPPVPQEPIQESSDPIQRRINYALGITAAA